MYSFTIKENKSNIDIVIVRILFALNATIAFLLISTLGFWFLLLGLLFALISYYIYLISTKISIHYLMGVGIISLTLLTWNFFFLLVLLMYWILTKYLSKSPEINISKNGIFIQRSYFGQNHSWNEIEFAVLKDKVLTIQLREQKFYQEDVVYEDSKFTSQEVNAFCDKEIETHNTSNKQ